MSLIKSKNLKDKSDNDIKKLLLEKREALRNFRFSISGSKTRNTKEGFNLRKEIAKLLTEASSRKTK